MISQIIYGILSACLPWLFSGSQTEQIQRVKGVKGLSRASLTGVSICLLFLVGCVYAGKRVDVNHILLEPGGYVEIATDDPIPVRYLIDGVPVFESRNLACTYCVPKKVYDEFQKVWSKNHPACLGDETSNFIHAGIPAVTCVILYPKPIRVRVDKYIAKKVLDGWVSMDRTQYDEFVSLVEKDK